MSCCERATVPKRQYSAASPSVQKCNLRTDSNTRGSSALVMVPNAVVPKLPLGCPSGDVLVRLKASARNSALDERSRVEIPARGALAIGQIRISDPVGLLYAELERCIENDGLGNRKWEVALGANDTGDLPAAGQHLAPARERVAARKSE